MMEGDADYNLIWETLPGAAHIPQTQVRDNPIQNTQTATIIPLNIGPREGNIGSNTHCQATTTTSTITKSVWPCVIGKAHFDGHRGTGGVSSIVIF
ncbi:hypothetical protein ACHAXS_009947, partial [Conticribra weissflogii]